MSIIKEIHILTDTPNIKLFKQQAQTYIIWYHQIHLQNKNVFQQWTWQNVWGILQSWSCLNCQPNSCRKFEVYKSKTSNNPVTQWLLTMMIINMTTNACYNISTITFVITFGQTPVQQLSSADTPTTQEVWRWRRVPFF